MTVGIIGAMEEEVTFFKEKMNLVTTKNICELEFYVGTIEQIPHNIVLVRSGMGKVNAAVCTQILIDMFAVDTVINVGVAGSLLPELGIGSVVISTDALYHDFDTSCLGDEPGVISRMDRSVFEADPHLIDLALEVAADIGIYAIKGRIATGDQFIGTPDVKKAIVDMFDASCCEMEGGAVAHTCYLNRIPFVIVRAISDNAEDGVDVDYPAFFKQSAVVAGAIIEGILKRL